MWNQTTTKTDKSHTEGTYWLSEIASYFLAKSDTLYREYVVISDSYRVHSVALWNQTEKANSHWLQQDWLPQCSVGTRKRKLRAHVRVCYLDSVAPRPSRQCSQGSHHTACSCGYTHLSPDTQTHWPDTGTLCVDL